LNILSAAVINKNNYTLENASMDRYLVVSPHTEKDCAATLKQMLYIGYITHFDWGCMDGDHTGWAIIEAANANEAKMVVPPTQRATTRVIRINKFSPSDIQNMH
jgi:hypothetical protein